ncbi:Kinesin-like protein KIF16B, partial [Orchesella cincta]
MTNIKVALRVRPLSQRETEANYPVVVAVENNSAFITDIRVPERPSADSRQRFRQFDFDHTFWFSNNGILGAASQHQVYTEMGPHLEKAILSGYNACLLAYGQSGTGKTFTMLGSKDEPGIIPRLCQSLWDKLKAKYPATGGKPGFSMEVSFLEIYREKVRDLLNPEKSLKLREHPQLGPHVQGLTRLEVTGEISLLNLLWEGERRRASGTTSSNRRSSRSHAIWTLYLTVHNNISHSHPDDVANNNASTSRRNQSRGSPARIITNQVHLVDLAGSEKADCTTAKSLLAEGADINRSLVALGNVISALAEKAQYIPYRDSALTWLLKDSIGGNASTSIIISKSLLFLLPTCQYEILCKINSRKIISNLLTLYHHIYVILPKAASPSSHCHAQTLNSLRFAQRARLVENTPKINLASATPSYSYGPYGYLSVMSAMELKKDITRLAKIIKTAQN